MANFVFTQLPGIAPKDIVKIKKADKAKLQPLEKQAQHRAAVGVMTGALISGDSENDAKAKAQVISEAVEQAPVNARNAHIATVLPDLAPGNPAAYAQATEKGLTERHNRAEDTSFGDQVSSAFAEWTGTSALMRMFGDAGRQFEPDPLFDPLQDRDLYEQGLAEEDRRWLRDVGSAEERLWKLERIRERQENQEAIGIHGAGRAVLASLVGGILDPVGWVAGYGIGKAAQLVGVGARAAYSAGQTGRAVGYAAGEGVVGNVLLDATLDASGQHITYQDYVISAAFGAGFGQLALAGARRGATESVIADDFRAIEEEALAQNHSIYQRAQERAGDGAKPEDVARHADQIMREEYENTLRIAFSDVPDGDKIMPRFEEGLDESGNLKPLKDLLSDPVVVDDVMGRWGMKGAIEDPVEAKLVAELALRAERWTAANPVDPARVDTLIAKYPWLASTGIQLAKSEHPIARFVAGNLIEVTTGAMGRRRTAAITKVMRERVYMQHLTNYEEVYTGWRNQNGGGIVKDVLGSTHRQEFDRAVALHRENRRLGVEDNAQPAVRRAADVLDTAYDLMRKDQQHVNTIGSARLGDNSIGYAPRSIKAAWLKDASNEQIAALGRELGKQLDNVWDDAAFAATIATRYLERARSKAYGGQAVPAHLDSPEAADVLADVMRANGVAEVDITKAMGKLSRGGASHTKKRLDLDLTAHITADDGKSFVMMDAFDTDQSKLFQNYARRTSGEVALTQHGVMGEQGMKLIRKALEYSENGKRASDAELKAFDQITAEFFGRSAATNNSKHLDNLRLLVGASRLGGMAFTQMAETANAVGALGVAAAFRQVKSMPRLIAEVRAGTKNPILDSIERVGGEIGTEHKVIFPYQEADDIRVFGRDSMNAFDRIVRGGANALPWTSGWHYVHSAQVRGMSEQIVHKMFRYVRQGGEDVALKDMGIDGDMLKRIKKELPNIAKFDKDGTLIELDITKAADHEAMATVVQAVHRGSKQIIQGTYIGESGKWAHDGYLRILTQFRSFSITSVEKQWARQRADYGTAKAFGLLVGAMSFALPIHFARVQVASLGREDREEYLEKQLAPDMLARAVLNYASLSGMAGDILDLGAAVAGYEMSGVRAGQRTLTDNIPAVGYVNTAFRGITEKDPRDLIRSLPGGNLPFLIPILNAAQAE